MSDNKEALEKKIADLWESAKICYKHGNFYEYLSYADPIKELTDKLENLKRVE